MSELSDESRALLGLEAELDEPTQGELDARRFSVFAALGVPAPAVPGPSAPGTGDTGTVPTPDPSPTSPSAPTAPGTAPTPSASQPTPSAPPPHGPTAAPTTGAAAPGGLSLGLKLTLGLAAAAVLGTLGVLAVGGPASDDLAPADNVGNTLPEVGEPDSGPSASDVAPPTTLEDPGFQERPTTDPEAEANVPRVPTARPRLREPEGADEPTEPTSPTHEPPSPTVTAPTPTEPAPGDPLSEESMLVAAGSAQLRAGHATEALALFERALARHPSGALRVEALAGRALALCRAGRMEAGQREAERFLASYPRSPSAPRIRSACQVEP